MKIKAILVLAGLVSINSIIYCDNEVTKEEQNIKEQLANHKQTFDANMIHAWKDLKSLIEDNLKSAPAEKVAEIKVVMDTIEDNITHMPRLLLSLCMYMKNEINKMESAVGSLTKDQQALQKCISALCGELIYLEIMSNHELTNKLRLEVLDAYTEMTLKN